MWNCETRDKYASKESHAFEAYCDIHLALEASPCGLAISENDKSVLELERTRFINPVLTGVFFLTGPRHQYTANSFQTGETAKKNGSKRGLWRV